MLLTVKEKKPVTVSSVEKLKNGILNKPTYLSDCYGRYSKHKESAYNDCRETHKSLDELNHYSNLYYCIYSHNSTMFTYYGLFEKINNETGEVELWAYYSTRTRDEIYRIIVE